MKTHHWFIIGLIIIIIWAIGHFALGQHDINEMERYIDAGCYPISDDSYFTETWKCPEGVTP